MSKARGLADLGNVYDDGALSNRNMVTNGSMIVAQRGISFTGTNAYTLDRWFVDNTVDGGGQVADAPDDFEYSLKINPSSGNATLRQAIELPAAGKGGLFRSGQTFTLSFWLKSDNAGENINIFIASASGVTGTTTTYVDDASTGLTTSTSWTKYTYTYTQSSNVGGSDTCYNIVPYVSSPSGAIYITGVQLEVGDTATPFEHPRSYSDELARCQRYCVVYENGTALAGNAANTTDFQSRFQYPVVMRAKPSASKVSGTDYRISDDYFSDHIAATLGIGSIATSDLGCRLALTGFSGLTAGRTYAGVYSTAQDAKIMFDAEL